ncbi:MAG TPA: preprotein translocase subunit SecE [Anaeromyxobacter sp.]|nr:preprotein translocase subunit SecE [Anaeromyxobacter sp.]
MENVGGVEQPRRIVAIFYVVAAIVLGMFLEKVLEIVFAAVGVNDFSILGMANLSSAIGFALAFLAAIVAWQVPKTQRLSLEIALELRRVTWPSLRETRAATIAVIIASFVAAVILGIFDLAWSWLSSKVY